MHENINDFEKSLRSLTPAGKAVNPIAAAFTAGCSDGRKSVHRWQAVVALVFAVGIAAQWRPTRTSHDVPLAGRVQIMTPIVQRPSDQSLIMLQKVISEDGVDALPAVRLAPSRPLNHDTL